MKRIVGAAFIVVAATFVALQPARGATQYPAVMYNASGTFRFANGVCDGAKSGSGNFSLQIGDSVTWANCAPGTDHTVTGTGFGNTNPISPGESVTYQFNTPGTFAYRCEYHPTTMTGTVTVLGESTTTTQQTATTATTAKATTTTSSTIPASTTTTGDINGVFTTEVTTSSTTSTTIFTTDTTRALGEGGEGGTSAGVVAALIVGLGAVGTVGALVIRRMRASNGPAEPPAHRL